MNEKPRDQGEYHHLKMRIKGDAKRVEFFHYLMRHVDADWPWRDGVMSTGAYTCAQCGGKFYKRPLMSCANIKAAAKQCGLRKVVIQTFQKEELCKKKGDIWEPTDGKE